MKTTTPLQPTPNKIIVIALRHLGDVLLTTPLIRSLRLAYPSAEIDVLVYNNTAAILENNPDINCIITTPLRPKRKDYQTLLPKIFRHYSLSVITQTGDRPFIYGYLAAKNRLGVVVPKNQTGWWKRFFINQWTEFDNDNTHTVLQLLKLVDLLNIPRHYALVPPRANTQPTFPIPGNYAVIHPHPMWHFKRWTLNGWVETAQFIQQLGLKVILSGGSAPEELAYVNSIHQQLSPETLNLAGKTSVAELGDIIGHAKLYIGPDTGITHLAAATGIPVIALFGPTNPVKWAPWPINYTSTNNPFAKVGDQRVNNVFLIQGKGDCVPCHEEGCDRHRMSHSACLDQLPSENIKNLARQLLMSN